MYNAMYFMQHHSPDFERLHEIRDRVTVNYLYPKARKANEELEKERAKKNLPSPDTVKVSSRMEHLPKPGIY